MNYQTKYPINEELIVTSTRQTFFKVYLKKKWILISLFFVLSVCAFIPDDPDGTGKIVGGVLSGVTFFLIVTWIKTYRATMANAMTHFRTTGEGTLHLNITDDLINISSESGSRKVKLDRITSLVETKDYVVLLTDKLPLFCLPKRLVDSDVVSWFLDRYQP